MPTTFYDRERAFEAKFAHDEEFRFLALARRDKLFARWAADTLGLSSEKAEDLVKSVLAIRDGGGHDQALLDYVENLFSTAGRGSDEKLPTVLNRCMEDARKQLIEQPPGRSDPL